LPSPNSYLNSYRSYDGIRFIAQGEFVGDNKSNNGSISYWMKPKKDKSPIEEKTGKQKAVEGKLAKGKLEKGISEKGKEGKKKKPKKMDVAIINMEGDTVRFYRVKPKEGLNSFGWRMNADGVEYPSRRDKEDDKDVKPGGYRVLPGKYMASVTFGDHKDSLIVEVKNDPRVKVSPRDMVDIQNTYKEYYKDVVAAKEAFDQIKEAKKSLGLIKKLSAMAVDSTQKELKEKAKEIGKSLDELEQLYMDKPDQKGIQRNAYNLNSYLWGARRYVGSSWKKPGANAMLAVKHAKEKSTGIIEQVNTFFDSDWTEFKNYVNELNLSPFKQE